MRNYTLVPLPKTAGTERFNRMFACGPPRVVLKSDLL